MHARLAVAASVVALLGALLPAPMILAAGTPVSSGAASVRSLDHASGPQAASADLAGALGADRTFHGAPGVEGAVDMGAWTLVSDLAAGEAPRFAPASSAVLASIAGPWSALGSNGAGDGALNGEIHAVAVSGTDLYVGGSFTNVGGIAGANHIAKWNGFSWSAVGAPYAINDQVDAIAISGTTLYAGGRFTDAAGIATADYVAKWNGSTWSALGSNVAGTGGAIAPSRFAPSPAVFALAVSGTDLYVGGSFIDVVGIPEADDMVKWNGSTWSAMGSGDCNTGCGAIDGAVYALAVSGTDLYVGGGFVNVGTLAGDYVAKWDGSAWSALGSGSPDDGAIWNDNVYALAVSGTDLYVGGGFYNAAGIATADRIARWDGAAWNAMGSGGPDGGALSGVVDALAVSASGADLYVGGFFWDTAGIATADHVALWGPPVVVRRPDGRIRLGTGAYVGNNTYNTTASSQTRTGSAYRGRSVTFGISIQNDGTNADRFLVKATGTARSAYSVKYFRGTTDITAAVVAGHLPDNDARPGRHLLHHGQGHRQVDGHGRLVGHAPGDDHLGRQQREEGRRQVHRQAEVGAAVGMAFGPAEGVELIDALASEPSLKSCRLLPSVRGDLLDIPQHAHGRMGCSPDARGGPHTGWFACQRGGDGMDQAEFLSHSCATAGW